VTKVGNADHRHLSSSAVCHQPPWWLCLVEVQGAGMCCKSVRVQWCEPGIFQFTTGLVILVPPYDELHHCSATPDVHAIESSAIGEWRSENDVKLRRVMLSKHASCIHDLGAIYLSVVMNNGNASALSSMCAARTPHDESFNHTIRREWSQGF
jgi:hypothetical protein